MKLCLVRQLRVGVLGGGNPMDFMARLGVIYLKTMISNLESMFHLYNHHKIYILKMQILIYAP